jgi:NDP-sugar pyrophosphorylase family protein
MSSNVLDIILLCGGQGSRFREVTNDRVPKSLYKVDDAELITYTLRALDPRTTGRLIFAVRHHAAQMQQWVNDQALPFDCVISTQGGEGVADAIRAAMRAVRAERVAVCNTDEILDSFTMNDLLQFHRDVCGDNGGCIC